MTQTREQLLQTYAALPEAYQPAWGLDETATQARRGSADRFAVLLQHIAALPGDEPLRVLDIGCAQGYFGLGLIAELRKQKRSVEVIGVDSLADNVRFCEQLADHHGLQARFIHDRFDAGFFERHSLDRFDAVLALNVLHHIRGLQGAQAAETALAAIRTHSRVLLCELAQPEEALDWVDDWHDSDHALLHGYAFRRRLGEFETHLTQVRRPLYVCSNELACVDGRWFAFDHVQDRAHPGVSDRFAGQRRFFLGKDTIVKAYRGAGDFGAFNRAELKAEAEVLQALSGEPRRYPPLLSQADDGDTLWLARGLLPGRLLSELIEQKAEIDSELLLRALLGELAHLEERGYCHADIRAWNMLWHGNSLRLIDFGSMTPQPSPLHRIALAAVIAEVARGTIEHTEVWYSSPRPLTDYPPAWRGLIRYLLGCPQAEFSYRKLAAMLDENAPEVSSEAVALCPEIMIASAQDQVDRFRRAQDHIADIENHLRETTAQAERERMAAREALLQARTYAASLESQLQRQTAEAQAERETATQALQNAEIHAASLRAQLERQTADAQAEREAAMRALQDAQTHAAALDAQLRRQTADAETYAASLQAQLQRQTADAETERAAAQAALAQASEYAQSLEHERVQLKARVQELETQLEQMRRRFRLLKPLWPHEEEGSE